MLRQLKHSDILNTVLLPHYLQILFPRTSEFGIHHSELCAEDGATLTPFRLTVLNRHMILTFRGPCIMIYSYNKTNKMHISQIYFWNRTQHVSDRFSVHHQESSTVHTATGICHTGFADCLLASSQQAQYWQKNST